MQTGRALLAFFHPSKKGLWTDKKADLGPEGHFDQAKGDPEAYSNGASRFRSDIEDAPTRS